MRDDSTIIIKGAEKGSVVIVWDRDDYLKDAFKQSEDRKVLYEEVQNDSSLLVNTKIKALEKLRLHGDLSSDTPNCFLLKIQNVLRFIFYLQFISV